MPARRFFALSFVGCALLLVYQVIFMARTSAARDLNHLRASRLTIQQAERFVLHGVNEQRLQGIIAGLQRHSIGREQTLLSSIPRASKFELSHAPSPLYVKALKTDAGLIPSVYPGLLRLSRKLKQYEFLFEDVFTTHFVPGLSLSAAVCHAIDQGYKAMIYVVPPNWSPKFGVCEFPIPVTVSYTTPPRSSKLLSFTTAEANSQVIESVIHGHIGEAVLVGVADESPENLAVFTEMAAVFHTLAERGWRPYRTIRFVSVPSYTLGRWAKKHSSWVQQNLAAFVNIGGIPGVSASPVLNRTLEWAVGALVDGDLVTHVPPRLASVNPEGGANTFQFDFEVPSVASVLYDEAATTRLLNLVVASISMEYILPFSVSDYSPYLKSTEFQKEAARFDAAIDLLKFEFTREYPWYQGLRKLRTIFKLKKANAHLFMFERLLQNHAGKHVVFATEKDGSRTKISPSPSDVAKAVDSILRSGFLVLDESKARRNATRAP